MYLLEQFVLRGSRGSSTVRHPWVSDTESLLVVQEVSTMGTNGSSRYFLSGILGIGILLSSAPRLQPKQARA